MAEEEKTSLLPKVNEAVTESKEGSSARNDNSNDKKTLYFLPKNPSQTAEATRTEFRAKQGNDSASGQTVTNVLARVRSAWAGFLGRGRNDYHIRKVPIKIEPKVFFANERTFLAWLHMSVTLATIAVAIVAFAETNEWSMIYGLVMMPVAIVFCCYSLYLYITRADMIRRKDPGPYENRTAPIILASLLGFSILINFFVKLYDIST